MTTLHWLKTRICSWWKDSPLVFLLLSLLVGLLLVFLVIAFSEDPEWAFCLFGIGEKFQILQFLGVAMGGVLLAIQAVTAHRRAKAIEETAQNAESGLRQERLKNAIEHIGQTSDSVRLGGAYELFHLAEDNQELRGTVLDILCAHVRRTTSGSEYQKAYSAEPSEEIQSLLTLLFTQEHDVFQGLRIHLAGSWLNGAHLPKSRLGGANLQGARLEKAALDDAQLQGANLRKAQFQGANLQGAQFQGANLQDAQFQGANLQGAQFQGANLRKAQFQGANLQGAQFQGANLRKAQFQGANLQGAQFQGAVSAGSWPDGFTKRMKDLEGCKSNLSGVIFSGGLTREEVDSILKGLSDEKAQELRERLEPHIDKLPRRELPKRSGALTGAYTSKQAEMWIAEYEKATSGGPTPETDDKGGG